MADLTVGIRIDLRVMRDAAQRRLQRLMDVLRFARSASSTHTKDQFDSYFEFFNLQPSQNTALEFTELRRVTDSWVRLHVMRDAIDIVNAFLDEAFRVCSLYNLVKTPNTLYGDLQQNRGALQGVPFTRPAEEDRSPEG